MGADDDGRAGSGVTFRVGLDVRADRGFLGARRVCRLDENFLGIGFVDTGLVGLARAVIEPVAGLRDRRIVRPRLRGRIRAFVLARLILRLGALRERLGIL